MSDAIVLSAEAVRWLQRLARIRDENDGWDESEPECAAWEELLALGMIEHRPTAFRLSDIGWWALGRAMIRGGE